MEEENQVEERESPLETERVPNAQARWGWSAAAIVLLIIVSALGLTYREVLVGDHARLSGRYDVYREVGPLSYYMDHCLHQGELPLWNPLTFCGMPYIGNPVTGALYPLNLLRSLLSCNPTPLKTQAGFIVLMGLHLLVAGVGIAFLARTYRLGMAASATASLVFLLSAIWVRRTCEYHFLFMIAWLPWLLLLARGAVNAPSLVRKAQYGIIAGLIFGLSVLSGALNIAPYVVVCVAGYAALQRLLRPDRDHEPASASGLVRALAGDGLFVLLFLVFTALAGMALLLPGGELASLSSRVKGSDYVLSVPHYAKTWQQLFHDLIRYPGTEWQVEDIRGAGIGALLLALAGLTHRNRRAVLINVALLLVLFDLSIGPPAPLSRIFYALSPIQMIASTRAFDFALLPFALLAGFGVDAVTAPWRADRGRPRRVLLLRLFASLRDGAILAAGIWLLFSLKPLLGGAYIGLAGGGPVPLRMWAVAVPGLTLCVLLLSGWITLPRFWRALLLAGVAGETLVWNAEYVPYMIYQQEYQRYAKRDFSTEFWSGNARGVDDFQNRHLYQLRGVMHGYEPVYIERVRETLASDGRGARYQRSVKDYEITQQNHRGNLFLKRQFWLARQYVRAPLIGKHDLFPAATTVFLPDAPALPVPEVPLSALPRSSISTDESGRHGVRAVWLGEADLSRFCALLRPGRRDRIIDLPEAATCGRHSALVLELRCAQSVAIESRFRDSDTGRRQDGKWQRVEPRGNAVRTIEIPLPEFARFRGTLTFKLADANASLDLVGLYLLSDTQDEGDRIQVLARSANRVSVALNNLPGHRILTFLDAWYPGWKARVDGEETPILRANDAFKAIVVPPGSHRVDFVYHSWRAYAGMAVTAFATAGGLVIAALLGRAAGKSRGRRARDVAAEGAAQ